MRRPVFLAHGDGSDGVTQHSALSTQHSALSNARVLVVDDEARNVRLLKLLLATHGYSVLTAAGGDEALQIIADERPDLILLDVMLPGIDGFEVCRRVREWEMEAYGHAPVLPVVMVTALSATDHRVKGLDAGA